MVQRVEGEGPARRPIVDDLPEKEP